MEMALRMRDRKRRCLTCSGDGVVHYANEHGEFVDPCPICDGTGLIEDEDEECLADSEREDMRIEFDIDRLIEERGDRRHE